MSQIDYYKLLQVSKNATNEEIKKSYRTLAMKHHPDRHTNKSQEEQSANEQKFKQISEAYQVLSNPENRHKYDHQSPNHPFSSTQGHHHHSSAFHFTHQNPMDLFNNIFNMHSHQANNRQQQQHFFQSQPHIFQTSFSFSSPNIQTHTTQKIVQTKTVNGKKVKTETNISGGKTTTTTWVDGVKMTEKNKISN